MKRHLIQIIIIAGLLSSCTNNARTVYVKADKVDGLTTEAVVTLNGYKIGKVDDIHLNQQGDIVIKLNLDKDPQIPTDSKFKIEHRDLLGTQGISVELGTENKMIASGDTIASFLELNTFQTDSLAIKIEDISENLTNSKKHDSILYELRRLNKNLEELKEEK